MSIFRKEVCYSIAYNDLNKVIQDYFKDYAIKDYCFISSEESINDCSHCFYVKRDLSEFDEEQIQEALSCTSGKMVSTGALLNKMCKDGSIERGKYVVHVCW